MRFDTDLLLYLASRACFTFLPIAIAFDTVADAAFQSHCRKRLWFSLAENSAVIMLLIVVVTVVPHADNGTARIMGEASFIKLLVAAATSLIWYKRVRSALPPGPHSIWLCCASVALQAMGAGVAALAYLFVLGGLG